MGAAFATAFAVAARQWTLIMVIGVGFTLGTHGIWPELLVLNMIVTISLTIIVHGRIMADLVPGRSANGWAILKAYSVNFLVAAVIIGLPRAIIRYFVVGVLPHNMASVAVGGVLNVAVAIVAMYVLPIVFLRNTGLSAVLAGVTFFTRHIRASLWIGALMAISYVLQATGLAVFRTQHEPWSFGLVMGTGIVSSFLLYMAFAAATGVLLGSPRPGADGAAG